MNQSIQAFPKDGLLAENLNLSGQRLFGIIGQIGEPAYSYVVTTVKLVRPDFHFEQHGSAPNFQGGYLTLCTCKHQMRASLQHADWRSKWIAGFTSRRLFRGRHWLFYLTKIERAEPSHAQLWKSLPSEVRKAKSASGNFLGDVFVPLRTDLIADTHDPDNYGTPSRHSHRLNSHDMRWHKDINYRLAGRFGQPSLLVGDPRLTFLWNKPQICFDGDHCRNFKKWRSISNLRSHLVISDQ